MKTPRRGVAYFERTSIISSPLLTTIKLRRQEFDEVRLV